MRELVEIEKVKPWECVGTKKESLLAFYLSWQKKKEDYLLKYFAENILPQESNLKNKRKMILGSWNKQNNLPSEFAQILKKLTKTS